MEPVIRLENVTKRYGSQIALDHVTLDVPPGIVFALLGENGAGKTTAIRVLLGLTDPDAGKATVLGINSTRHGHDVRSRVGYVPERPTLYEWMTVSEIGWFTAGFYGSGFFQRYLHLAADYQLPLKRQIKSLSKGMRAKVSLSLALAHEPELLILDEPTSGLDTLVRREFLEGMVDIAAAGRTVLLSSHQIGEVERVADIVAILRAGKLLLVERLETLKDQIRELNITLADRHVRRPADQRPNPLRTAASPAMARACPRYERSEPRRVGRARKRCRAAHPHAEPRRNLRRLSETRRAGRRPIGGSGGR